jgi:hypothetical protein
VQLRDMNISYRINKIKTSQFAIFPDKFVNGEGVTIDTNFNFAVSTDFSNIRCITNLTYSQDDHLLLTTEIQCFFDISPEGSAELKKKNRVPVEFLRYMATIVVGTARGIIHAKTENTVLNPLVLPPVNLMEAITDDFELNTKSDDKLI